jgi:hypothetical protein
LAGYYAAGYIETTYTPTLVFQPNTSAVVNGVVSGQCVAAVFDSSQVFDRLVPVETAAPVELQPYAVALSLNHTVSAYNRRAAGTAQGGCRMAACLVGCHACRPECGLRRLGRGVRPAGRVQAPLRQAGAGSELNRAATRSLLCSISSGLTQLMKDGNASQILYDEALYVSRNNGVEIPALNETVYSISFFV